MRTFRFIYVNCINRLRFLAEISTKLQKMHFLGQFKDHNSGRQHGTRQMTTFFSSTFSALFVISIFVFENSQNSFSCGTPFGPFWSVKFVNFVQKLPFRTAHHIFLGSGHAEVIKNPYYVLSPEGSLKKVSAHGLIKLSFPCIIILRFLRIWFHVIIPKLIHYHFTISNICRPKETGLFVFFFIPIDNKISENYFVL